MKKQLAICTSGTFMRLFRIPFLVGILPLCLLLLGVQSSRAHSATWNLNPSNGDWNRAANWTPATVPDGPSDIATFALSNVTGISFSHDFEFEVNEIVFEAGASPFIITLSSPDFIPFLFIEGVGITNNSGITQNFVTPGTGTVRFFGSATAGSLTTFTNMASKLAFEAGGSTDFFGTSSAASGTFINEAGIVTDGFGGVTEFYDAATAGNGNFINRGTTLGDAAAGGETDFIGDDSNASLGTFTSEGGGVSSAPGGYTRFFSTSSAGDAIVVAHGGAAHGAGAGQTLFFDSSTAERATLVADGGGGGADSGVILFFGTSRGGRATVQLHDRGRLDISFNTAGSVSIGSLEGSGSVHLGAENLAVGNNNRSTVFSGRIQDGGAGGGSGGSLTKEGQGSLTLSGSSGYSGGTIINRGTLMVRSSSATGSGSAQVNGGTLTGDGTISGAVTVGNGTGTTASISPRGAGGSTATLTIESEVIFHSGGTYDFRLNSETEQADTIVAAGATLDSGAVFGSSDDGGASLPPGTTFIAIDNTAATPISGNFENLPEGTVISIGSDDFAVSYEGGDGNDLTLTVLP
jgi:autotransporter-associated beta strand protein